MRVALIPALIPLVTPVSGLLLGRYLNGEALTPEVRIGTGLILNGLALFERVGCSVLNKSARQS